jgi:L-ascorbate metabolism protein UlaG (beta-lactamase superfamily)
VDWGPWFFASDDCKSRPFVRNDTLWAEGVLLAKDFRFFFCGDTGYSPVFKEIGDKYGPFDLSAIPIGAYAPRWFMRHYHITPEEAARSTWMCAPKNPLPSTVNPINRMRAGLAEDAFVLLQHGQTIVLDHEKR